MRRIGGLAWLAAAVVSITGACSRGEERTECSRATAYQSAQAGRELEIPDDLSVPDQSDALQIPEPVAPVEERTSECLEHSPAFAQEPEAGDD